MQEQINLLQAEILELKQQLLLLSTAFYKDNYPNDIYFNKNVTFKQSFNFADGTNIPLGTSSGTKIGTSASQKLGFFNATPIVQVSAISAPSGGATQDAESRTAINSIRSALTNLGLTA